MTTKRAMDEIRFWEGFIDHWERVHEERAPARAYDALNFARLRLRCMLDEMAFAPQDSAGDAPGH